MTEDNNQQSIPQDNKTTRIDGLFEDLELADQKARERETQIDDAVIPWVIELRVVGTPEIIRVPLGERLTLGRGDQANSVSPEIDLTNFNAQRLGVSRKHARIIMRDNRLTIEDIGSSNGTYVNGKHIGVLAPIRIHDGDQIRLGNLVLQVHFVLQPHSDEDTMHGIGNTIDVPQIGNGQRILILDDNRQVCAVVRMIAVQAGFTVAIAHDTNGAISQWDSGDIDAIIVELMLEDSNGLDLVDYVRQNPKRKVPIIATTSTSGGYRENQALAKGVNDILNKPLNVEQIMGALGKVTEILNE